VNQAPLWLFGAQMIVMVGNAFVMANSAAGAISVRPEAAGTASDRSDFAALRRVHDLPRAAARGHSQRGAD